MRWNLSRPIVGGLLVAAAIGIVVLALRWFAPPAANTPAAEPESPAKVEPATESPAAAPVQPATEREQVQPPTIESSGEILGVAIGMPMDEARAKLDPLRAPAPAYQPDAKELRGRRILWRLKDTDYAWIMVWAGGDGTVTRVRATLRPEQTKPFSEIGDLTRAVAADSTSARWNLRRPAGPNYRLIVQGADERASSVYMFSLDMPINERQENSEAADEG